MGELSIPALISSNERASIVEKMGIWHIRQGLFPLISQPAIVNSLSAARTNILTAGRVRLRLFTCALT